jgi:4-amino-4-deoxy-L-arabinose transferase-like glycosyltransferase
LVSAGIFKIAGYSIATSRIGSLLFSLLAIIALYAVSRRSFGDRQAFLICLAMVIHPWFWEVSRRCRPEIHFTALSLSFLWMLMLFFESHRRRTAFFAGILAGLSVLTHPTAAILIFSIACAALWFRITPIGRLILWAGLGLFLTVLPYVIYVIYAMQDPMVSFTEQMQMGLLHTSTLRRELVRWRSFLQWPLGAPLALVMFASWLAAWYRSSATEKASATAIALFALILPLASVNQIPRYLVGVLPFFCILILRLFQRITERANPILKQWYRTRILTGTAMAVIYMATSLPAIGLMFYHLHKADWTKVADRVASVVGPDSRVYGHPVFWFNNNQYQYGLRLYRAKPIPMAELLRWFRKHRFDYIVKTAWSTSGPSRGFSPPPSSMPAFRINSDTDWLCSKYGSRVDEFYDPYYGPVEIYKLNWDWDMPYQFRRQGY